MNRTRTSLAVLTALAATTVGSAVLAPGTALAAGDTEGCSTGALSPSLLGSPQMKGGAAAGEYLGHTDKGWTLRVSHPGKSARVFTGTVRATGAIAYTPVRLEKDDKVTLSGDRKTLTFVFHNHGGIDGINFTDSCARHTTFRLADGGAPTRTDDIWLGSRRVHPTSNPFTASRG